VFGGHETRPVDGSTEIVMSPTTYRAAVDSDGEMGTWEAVADLALTRTAAAFAATPSGALIAAGGYLAPPFGGPTSTVVVADIRSASPSWQTTPSLPSGRGGAAPLFIGRDFYSLGGAGGTYEREIFAAPYELDGGLGTFRAAGAIPEAASLAAAAVGSRVYIADGLIANTITVRAGVSWAERLPDGTLGSWNDAGITPIDGGAKAPIAHSLAAVGGRLVFLGGSNSGNVGIADVFVGTIAADGSVSWATSTPLPYPVRNACVVVDADSIYVLGGEFATSIGDVARGRLLPNGAIQWKVMRSLPSPREGLGCALL
jgi:hypothetical protein